jgi:hypothetical protein
MAVRQENDADVIIAGTEPAVPPPSLCSRRLRHSRWEGAPRTEPIVMVLA